MTTAHASHNTDAREEMHLHARQFLRQWHDESGTPGFTARWRHLSAEIAATGTWQPTSDELTYGARVAWRNAGRCLGRARWSSLIVRDRRHTTTLPTLLQELTAHLDEATNNGRVRSVLTVLAPATAIAAAPLRIISPQLARYAAWHTDGGVIGDPANLTLTALARRLGWDGPRTAAPSTSCPGSSPPPTDDSTCCTPTTDASARCRSTIPVTRGWRTSHCAGPPCRPSAT